MALKISTTRGMVSHLFSAAVTLFIEIELTGSRSQESEYGLVKRLCDLLKLMEGHNRVAAAALRILETLGSRSAESFSRQN